MSRSSPEHLQELFAAALALEPEERRALLAAERARDPKLGRELASLLEHAGDEDFLVRPLVLEALEGDAARTIEGLAAGRLGPFELLRVLGEGGMGVVHLAREEGLERLVALKVLKAGLATPSSLARFEREARALAKLHHPGVAQVHAAGTLDAGAGPQPYFAMELVEGRSITEHADREGLDLRARLALLAEVADAIDHAHARGVVHRDLKPSNVLVDTSSGRAQPKVLDFGVARLLDEEAEGPRTLAGQIVGTLAYMSPEQASGEARAIGPAADVYGLGALGYELVTGKPPLDLRGLTLLEAARRVREEEPLPAGRIRPEARGEVETLLARALAKEPERRYPSAAELARDLRRFLAHEPIQARPPSGVYLARKFARRHRGLVLAIAAVLLALTGGTVASWRQAVQAAQERDRARHGRLEALESQRQAEAALKREARQRREAQEAAERAGAVVGLLRRMLEDAHPMREGREVRVHDVLDRTAASLGEELAGHPHVELEMRSTLGAVYQALGLYPEARRELEQAAALAGELHGELHAATLDVQRLVGVQHLLEGSRREAQALLENAVARSWLLLGEEHRTTLRATHSLVALASDGGGGPWAEELCRRLIETSEGALGPLASETLDALHVLGRMLTSEGRLAEARAVLEDAHARSELAFGSLDARSVTILGALATVLRYQGLAGEAQDAYRRALDAERVIRGPDHPRTWTTMNNLAALLQAEGQHTEAEPLLREVVERRQDVLGAEHPDTLIALNNLALLLSETGRLAEARELHERGLELKRRSLGDDHRTTLRSLFNLALIDLRVGDHASAEPLFAEVVERAARAFPADHWQVASFLEGHAVALQALGRHDEAEQRFTEAYESSRQALGPDHARTRGLANRLVVLLEGTGRSADAGLWRERKGE